MHLSNVCMCKLLMKCVRVQFHDIWLPKADFPSWFFIITLWHRTLFPVFFKKIQFSNFISILVLRALIQLFYFPSITCTSFDAWQTKVCQTHRRHTSRDTSVVNVNFNIGVVRRFLFSSCYGETSLLVMPLYFITFFHKAWSNVTATVSCGACNSNYSPCSK